MKLFLLSRYTKAGKKQETPLVNQLERIMRYLVTFRNETSAASTFLALAIVLRGKENRGQHPRVWFYAET